MSCCWNPSTARYLSCGHPRDQVVYELAMVVQTNGQTAVQIVCPRCEQTQQNPENRIAKQNPENRLEKLERLFARLLFISEEELKQAPLSPRARDSNYPGKPATFILADGDRDPLGRFRLTLRSATEGSVFTKITVLRADGEPPSIQVEFKPCDELLKLFFKTHHLTLQEVEFVKGYYATKTSSDVLRLTPLLISNNSFNAVWTRFMEKMMADNLPQ
jgi:hypothetical protein